MARSRTLTLGTAAALALGAALLVASPAHAATTYVGPDDLPFPVEDGSALEGWFKGAYSTDPAAGAESITPSGLQLEGRFQLLNADVPALTLEQLATTTNYGLVSGPVFLQFPLFFDSTDINDDSNLGFTTLRPQAANQDSSTTGTLWRSSRDFGLAPGTVIPANSINPLSAYLDVIADQGLVVDVLAYGIFVDPGETSTVYSITAGDDTTWFLPAPTATATTPAAPTVEQATTTGVSATFTGFLPGEAVTADFATEGFGGPVDGDYVADADGVITVSYILPADTVPGTYLLGATGDTTSVNAVSEFTVVAAAAPELADTGAETAGLIALASGLLIAGTSAIVVTSRRRRTTAG